MTPAENNSDHVLYTVIDQVKGHEKRRMEEAIIREEPLEIRIRYGKPGRRKTMTLAITMRTPGEDEDLVLGFLFTEGIIRNYGELLSVSAEYVSAHPDHHAVVAELDYPVFIEEKQLSRHIYTSSSCGVCGKTAMDLVRQQAIYILRPGEPVIPSSYFFSCGDQLSAYQPTFEKTGGNHAAALFDLKGQCLSLKEDVGRHNAMDKLIGSALRLGRIPLSDDVVFVSGRASFELVQKSIQAGIPIFAAVGAASSLAVELAAANDQTLIGFLKGHKFNVYSCPERIQDL